MLQCDNSEAPPKASVLSRGELAVSWTNNLFPDEMFGYTRDLCRDKAGPDEPKGGRSGPETIQRVFKGCRLPMV